MTSIDKLSVSNPASSSLKVPHDISDVTHPTSPPIACAAQAETPLRVPHTITDYGSGLVSLQGLDCP